MLDLLLRGGGLGATHGGNGRGMGLVEMSIFVYGPLGRDQKAPLYLGVVGMLIDPFSHLGSFNLCTFL